MVRADAARRVSIGRDDERAVRAVRRRCPSTPPMRRPKPAAEDPVHRELAALPRPRKHYQWYYSTREANADMHRAPQGVHDFLRAYYHHKSADWKDNKPYPLKSWSGGRTGKTADLLRDGSRQGHGRDGRGGNAVGRRDRRQPMAARQRACLLQRRICPHRIQGGLQWYRCGTSGAFTAGIADLVGPHHRRALRLHLGQAGLGHLSAPRRLRGDAVEGLHAT